MKFSADNRRLSNSYTQFPADIGLQSHSFRVRILCRLQSSCNAFPILKTHNLCFSQACLIFFDEIDAVGGARFDDGAGGDNEVQRTMLELINQLDGFDPRGNIKVLMATNRPDTLDPALLRPGRLDRKVEFGLPDLEGRANIFKIHARSMSVERDIRYASVLLRYYFCARFNISFLKLFVQLFLVVKVVLNLSCINGRGMTCNEIVPA